MSGRRIEWVRLFAAMAVLMAAVAGAPAYGEKHRAGQRLDLSHATIVAPSSPTPVAKAAAMLADETSKRTGLRLPVAQQAPDGASALIVLQLSDSADSPRVALPAGLAVPAKAEGYALWVAAEPDRVPTVHLVGRDQRGLLFAAGRLLRLMHYENGALSVDQGVQIATAPRFALRGHQLGYRETPNAYDAWDVPTYEQYVKDLALFGTNCVEFTTSLEAKERRGPNMAKSTWEGTADIAKMLKDYDIQCWTWQELPSDVDIAKPEVAAKLYAQFRDLFKSLDGFDALFVPGGDGGIAPAKDLMPFLERLAPILHEVHPNATLWVSNQTFAKEENDYFFDLLQKQQPAWLDGVVYGPWTKLGPDEMRQRTPARYPVRLYPDITHNVRAQYPVPNWDRAFAHGLNREAPNPRPVDMQIIFKRYASLVGDSISYSEGVNDDLNKFVWSALGWDPDTPLQDILLDYGKMFFGDAEAETVAKGLRMLEDNWRGPIAENKGIARTLKLWQGVEKRRDPNAAPNWRLQMYLMRAYYDVYLQKKTKAETRYENEAYAALKKAPRIGVGKAIADARAALAQADSKPAAPECRAEIERLATGLRKSIGMQLSVRAPFYASGPERGALLDTIDTPMNNRGWLENELSQVLAMPEGTARLDRINTIVSWEKPGPGGYYDDLGNATKQPHLVVPLKYAEDPGYVDSAQCEYQFMLDARTLKAGIRRMSWLDQAETLYGQPLRMHYEGLDPKASYRVRVTYAGRFASKMRLLANGAHEIHGWHDQPANCGPEEFSVPAQATQNGVLDLEWQLTPEMNKLLPYRPMARGCQVAEVWLLKQ